MLLAPIMRRPLQQLRSLRPPTLRQTCSCWSLPQQQGVQQGWSQGARRPLSTGTPEDAALISVGVIGCGQMGTAMLRGFLATDSIDRAAITVSDIDSAARDRAAALGAAATADNLEVAATHDVLLLGTEPEDIPHVLAEITPALDPTKLLISIAAGIRTADMLAQVPPGVRVARVMPNTPCVVGEGAAGFCLGARSEEASPDQTAEDRAVVRTLLGASGEAVETEERLMDAVTGDCTPCAPHFSQPCTPLLCTAQADPWPLALPSAALFNHIAS